MSTKLEQEIASPHRAKAVKTSEKAAKAPDKAVKAPDKAAKGPDKTAQAAEDKKATVKKTAARAVTNKRSNPAATKKTAKKKAAVRREPPATVKSGPSPAARQRAIEKIAYSLSESRGFAPGFEQSDWLTAETIVEELLGDG